jgi:hypothetical protein
MKIPCMTWSWEPELKLCYGSSRQFCLLVALALQLCWKSFSGYPFLSVLSWLAIFSCRSYPGLVVQLQLSCPVLDWLSSYSYTVLSVLSRTFFVPWWGYPSCQFYPESAVLFWQSVLAPTISTIHYASSHALLVHSACPFLGCPVLAVMSFGHASE